MANILLIDESALMRRVICDILKEISDLHMVDICKAGKDAKEFIQNKGYDIVILDLVLLSASGIEILKAVHQKQSKAKCIAITSSLPEDTAITMQAMEVGAFEFVVKPLSYGAQMRKEFQNKIKQAVLTATEKAGISKNSQNFRRVKKPSTKVEINKTLIALACSTGGPKALHEVIPKLPKDLAVPMIVVQHMPKGFTKSLAERLNQMSLVEVKEAEQDDVLQAGVVYIAPGGKHMEIISNARGQSQISILDSPPVNNLKPCADVTYRSLKNSNYQYIVCVVLTGMGSDAMEGIKELSHVKQTSVISESAETCVVYGMPKAVEQNGLSDEVVPINEIAQEILKKIGG